MNAPEAYIQFTPGLITDAGKVTVPSTEEFLRELHGSISYIHRASPSGASTRRLVP